MCDELRGRGEQVRLECRPLFGDDDVRLQVGRPDGLLVEVLGPWGEGPCGDRWQAIRADPHGRALWCGPSIESSSEELIGFVEDLIVRDEDDLGRRDVQLG